MPWILIADVSLYECIVSGRYEKYRRFVRSLFGVVDRLISRTSFSFLFDMTRRWRWRRGKYSCRLSLRRWYDAWMLVKKAISVAKSAVAIDAANDASADAASDVSAGVFVDDAVDAADAADGIDFASRWNWIALTLSLWSHDAVGEVAILTRQNGERR